MGELVILVNVFFLTCKVLNGREKYFQRSLFKTKLTFLSVKTCLNVVFWSGSCDLLFVVVLLILATRGPSAPLPPLLNGTQIILISLIYTAIQRQNSFISSVFTDEKKA